MVLCLEMRISKVQEPFIFGRTSEFWRGRTPTSLVIDRLREHVTFGARPHLQVATILNRARMHCVYADSDVYFYI